MPPRQIPGFYYDEAKGKYFKIEPRATAPPTAPWSAENVKKRALRDRDRERRESKRGRAAGCQPLRQSFVALGRCFAGDKLTLECEGVSRLEARGRELVNTRARVWAQGLGYAGKAVSGEFWGFRTRISDFAVVTGDVERLAYIYVANRNLTGPILAGKYAPTDHCGRVCFDFENTGLANYPIDEQGEWMNLNHELAAVGYNPHKKVFFASAVPNPRGPGTPFFYHAPVNPMSDCPITERRRLQSPNGVLRHAMRSGSQPPSAPIETYTAVPAPYNSPYLCFLGTSAGGASYLPGNPGTWDFLKPTRRGGAIFAVDCSHLDPDLVVTGGRKGIISTTDARSGGVAGEFRHGTTATHLRVAPDGNGHKVLVAGVSNTMAIYDRRWPGRSQKALPVLTFPEYRNEARVQIGWDVCAETGVVVAAEGSGAVGLYSVASGARVGELPLGAMASEGDPVACLRVARVGSEAMPSVFVAIGRGIVKFSWSLTNDDDPGG